MTRDLSPKTVGVRALDLGYYNVKYSTGVSRDARRVIETDIFPSQAPIVDPAVLRNHERTAPLRGESLRIGGVLRYVGEDVQSVQSGSAPNPVTETYSTSPVYKALTYGAFSRMAQASHATELRIEMLVVGLPPSRLDEFAEPLEDWLKAGPHRIEYGNGHSRVVAVDDVLVVAQPYGAYLDYFNSEAAAPKGSTVVVDVGGGTVDWFVASTTRTDWARTGSHPKGMTALAHGVANAIDPDLRHNPHVVRQIDDAIRSDADRTFEVSGELRDIGEFEATLDEVLRESCDQMMTRLGNVSDVRTFIFTGGGAKVFAKYMRDEFPKLAHQFHVHKDPLFGNVRGFHLEGQRSHAMEKARAA